MYDVVGASVAEGCGLENLPSTHDCLLYICYKKNDDEFEQTERDMSPCSRVHTKLNLEVLS